MCNEAFLFHCIAVTSIVITYNSNLDLIIGKQYLYSSNKKKRRQNFVYASFVVINYSTYTCDRLLACNYTFTILFTFCRGATIQ